MAEHATFFKMNLEDEYIKGLNDKMDNFGYDMLDKWENMNE